MEGGGGGRGTMERKVNSILRRQGEGERGGGSLREGRDRSRERQEEEDGGKKREEEGGKECQSVR